MPIDSDGINLYTFLCGLASFSASLISNLFHPFEVIKTRLQSHDGKKNNNIVPEYRNTFQAVKTILQQEGIRGLYKGFMFSYISASLANTTFFVIYERVKRRYEIEGHKDEKMRNVTLASLEAAILCSIVTQPFWVIKTRMLLNIQEQINGYNNFMKATRQIYQQHGLRGYYRGLTLNLLLSFNGIVQMQTYEAVKLIYQSYNHTENAVLSLSFVAGGFSKITSTLLTYPLTTVRTRIQQNQYFDYVEQPKYRNILDISARLWREEGLFGFYKGIVANILKGVLQRGVYFYCYELFKMWLHINKPQQGH